MLFAFLLFLTLGLAEFIPLQGNMRTVAMVVFAVLMVLWLVLGASGMELPRLLR